MDDLISRQAAIMHFVKAAKKYESGMFDLKEVTHELWEVPSEELTLYGYKIEHLSYIARVMEKEGVTADYAVRTFDDMSRALRMILEEAQERVMETLNERYDLQTGGD